MKPVLSVIVNFYQSAAYVQTCIDSLLGQTLHDMEIIAVDDGSKDNTVHLLQAYANNYEHFRLITKPNSGLAASRKTGLEAARGQYITFVDGDDFLSLDIYEKMVNCALADNLDIVQCNIIPWGDHDHWKEVESGRIYPREIISGKDLLQMYLNREVMPALWQRIFLRDIARPESFKTESKVMSDHFNFPEWASEARRVRILPEQGYYWLTRKGSLGQPSEKIQMSNAKNRFLSGISILGFSGVNAPENRIGVLHYLTSYMTQTAYHLRQAHTYDFSIIYDLWDSLKEPFNMMSHVYALKDHSLLFFFTLLEENRDLWPDYVCHSFLEEQAGFISSFHYNGDDIFYLS